MIGARDPRWDDPNFIPLSNGPQRQATPPGSPSVTLQADGLLIEYLLPYPMHIIDPQAWPPLRCVLGNRLLEFEKPSSILQPFEPVGRMGNESPDAFCSILRVYSGHPDRNSPLTPQDVWPLAESLLTWIRVKARHYWLLEGGTGFASLFRGSVFAQHEGQVEQQNFASYGRIVIVRPLSQDLWKSIETELVDRSTPPVSESIFCDALTSIVANDDAKAVLELGVAAEIELTRLLDEVSVMEPQSKEKQKYRKLQQQRRWPKFGEKLSYWPRRLGLGRSEDFQPSNFPPDWVRIVKSFYLLRNSIAHSGILPPSVAPVSAQLFATNALFAYCREERARVGLSVYTLPSNEQPFGQLVASIGT